MILIRLSECASESAFESMKVFEILPTGMVT